MKGNGKLSYLTHCEIALFSCECLYLGVLGSALAVLTDLMCHHIQTVCESMGQAADSQAHTSSPSSWVCGNSLSLLSLCCLVLPLLCTAATSLSFIHLVE